MSDRPALVRAFTDELPLKIVSLVIAVTLFVIVRGDKDAATAAYVRVIYTLPQDKVLVSDPPGEVRVGVRGPWTRLQRFDERAVEPIRVELKDAPDGAVHFDETMVKLPVGLRVASISPSEVKLEFEKREVREVPIQPILEGQPAEGFRVAKVTTQPSSVHVEGGTSAVDAITRVQTRPLQVTAAHAPVVGEVQLQTPPRHTRFLDAQQVVVHAEIQPAIVERTFESLPIKVLGLTRLEGHPEPTAARLILRGPSDLVLGMKVEQISLSVDAALLDSRPPSRMLRNVSVQGLPEGVAAEVQPDTVMLVTARKKAKD
jgi:YbbR domain-containing protein